MPGRPSTASRPDSVIDKLNIESSDDGAGVGITIAGIFVSANCSVILIIMSIIFILVGIILTAISYRPRDLGEAMEKFLSRQEWGAQLKIMGPVFMLCGVLMLLSGMTFCFLGYKVSKEEEERWIEASSPNRSIYAVDPMMPTIAQALMRNPSFPLIVPQAEWTTPQVTKSYTYSYGRHRNAIRPRAASLQIPFMGGTIVPSAQVDWLNQASQRRRNSLPAHHTISERPIYHRRPSRVAFVINEMRKSGIHQDAALASRLKRNLSRSNYCTTARALEKYSQLLECPEFALMTTLAIPKSKDIACFPTSTFHVNEADTANVTEILVSLPLNSVKG